MELVDRTSTNEIKNAHLLLTVQIGEEIYARIWSDDSI